MQVSLITCTNNSEKTIKDCCLSILSQTHKDIEHIIIDKNSLDRTISIIKQYGRKNLRIYQQKGSGIYGALNEGMKMANGHIIGILHSDDKLMDNKVIKIITEKFFEENLDVLFSNIYYTKKNNTNRIVRKWFSNLQEGVLINKEINKKINNGWMPPHTTLFIKKDLLSEIGFYDESLVNEITSESLVGWSDAMPVVIIGGLFVGLGLFATIMLMREWQWLNQFKLADE